jgi:hypothetical protein
MLKVTFKKVLLYYIFQLFTYSIEIYNLLDFSEFFIIIRQSWCKNILKFQTYQEKFSKIFKKENLN